MTGFQSSTLSLSPTSRGVVGGARNTSSFLEPISGQTIARTGEQPIDQWIGGLPQTDVGLSTIDRWQADISPQAAAQTIRTEIAARLTPATSGARSTPSVLDGYRQQFDTVKVGYAMGQVAAGIEARISGNPDIPHANAAALARELRDQGAALSYGAAREATAAPQAFTFNGQCYADADSMARAAIAEFNNPTRPSLREYTPAMQQRDAQAAMDRAMMAEQSPLGLTWGQTAWMFARGNGASLEQQQRAFAAGNGADAILGVAGSVAGAAAARGGMALPGGQARPTNSGIRADAMENMQVRIGPAGRQAAPSSPAVSIADAPRLRIQLTAQEISGGHAFDKHVLGVNNPNGSEFAGLGVRTRAQFATHIESVISNPTRSGNLANGRNYYYDGNTNTVVITNPRAKDGGTAFRPTNGEAYLRTLR